jgi:thioredoxin 2
VIRKCPSCGKNNRIPPEHLADRGRCGACKAELPPVAEPIEADPETFDSIIGGARVPVLVDFWAAWCGPCRMVAPIVEQIATEYEGQIKVGKLDVDANQRTAVRFNVRSIPSILFFKDGQLVDTVVGAVPKPILERKVKELL